ncbi:D-alanyl-D-alanine dipeptidase [Saccharopolyspora kobensis]|uniref:D-alanyl-D-alanine dipeptidase n=1 Tax=Saccharopolyspora kobensis TaxID=146035 RepID=A0A1H6DGN9_9PSEU|nr:M15 family metallopeptidase [Saccharopolyspora kobensis]SEG83766.1 D-alanyl-D-alanine dipeptidase [Saccharopolyspora kobensis]SFE33411.1 D-Ala-D-Ala dipeptidase vanX. Metallo peptidase. MEROPS family M15D [Saccharopolyspora kobensis]
MTCARRLASAVVFVLAATACGTTAPPAPAPAPSPPAPSPTEAPSPSPAEPVEQAPAGFVRLRDVDPSIIEEIRYATSHNFTGDPVPGYDEPMCVVTRPLAEALHAAQQRLAPQGYTLKVYDCYRPRRADTRFVEWAEDVDDQRMKAEFYPGLDKSRLFADGYIAERSGHSRGSSVDLTLVRLPANPQRPYVPGEPLTSCSAEQRFPDNSIDMATGYDCFDSLSHTDDPRVTGEARANRDLLRDVLTSVGLQNYRYEWWHFNLPREPFPDQYFDFPVNSAAFR